MVTTPSSMQTKKTALRAQVLAQGRQRTPSQYEQAAEKLSDRLFELPACEVYQHIALYWSFQHEVPTQEIFQKFQDLGKRLYLPRMTLNGDSMEFVEISDPQSLSPGFRGVLEPARQLAAVPLTQIEWMIVPGVAFDPTGARLGWGEGCYDRVLVNYRGFTLGLAYDFQILPKVPRDAHDVLVQAVLSESHYWDQSGSQ